MLDQHWCGAEFHYKWAWRQGWDWVKAALIGRSPVTQLSNGVYPPAFPPCSHWMGGLWVFATSLVWIQSGCRYPWHTFCSRDAALHWVHWRSFEEILLQLSAKWTKNEKCGSSNNSEIKIPQWQLSAIKAESINSVLLGFRHFIAPRQSVAVRSASYLQTGTG